MTVDKPFIIGSAQIIDANDIIELMYSSGSQIYDYIYQTNDSMAKDYLHYEFLSGRGFCGSQNVTVIYLAKELAGIGCFYGASQYLQLWFGSLLNILTFFPLKAWIGVLWRSNYIVQHIIQRPQRHELYLANFAVKKAYRNKGAGSFLLVQKMRWAQNNGYRLFGLDVADNNPLAEKLYSRHGLACTKLKPFKAKSRLDLHMPTTKKMEKYW